MRACPTSSAGTPCGGWTARPSRGRSTASTASICPERQGSSSRKGKRVGRDSLDTGDLVSSRRGVIAFTWGSFWAERILPSLVTEQGREGRQHRFDLFSTRFISGVRLKETDRPRSSKTRQDRVLPLQARQQCHPRPRRLTRPKADPLLRQCSINAPVLSGRIGAFFTASPQNPFAVRRAHHDC